MRNDSSPPRLSFRGTAAGALLLLLSSQCRLFAESGITFKEWIIPNPLVSNQPLPTNGKVTALLSAPVELGNKTAIRVTNTATGSRIPIGSATTEGCSLTFGFANELSPNTRYVLQLLDGAVKGAGGSTGPVPEVMLEFTTAAGGLTTEVVVLQHAWVEAREVGLGVRVEGVESIARQFFDETQAARSKGSLYPSGATLLPDKDRNAFIIADTPEHIAAFKAFIANFDVPPLLVEVSVAIIDLSTEAGFTWESQTLVGTGEDDLQTTDSKTKLLSTLGGATKVAPLLPVDSPPFLSGRGFTLNTLIKATRGNSLSILSSLQALETKGEAQILSRPAALTVNNRQVSLEDRLTYNVPVRGYENARLYPVTSGTNIRILPHVIELGQGQRALRLAVWIDNGSAVTAKGNEIPAVATTTISTQAIVRENESLLIAGSYRHAEGRDDSYVPFLGKIPVLGWPFKNKAVNQAKLQRMFLITPKVLNPDVQLLSRQNERAAAMLREGEADAAGWEMNRANEGQAQNALGVDLATGSPRKILFPRLRRALHTGQNP